MTVQALDLIANAVRACVGWFDRLFSAIDGYGILMAMCFVAISFGVLLNPISRGGVGSSDTAKPKNRYKGKHEKE